MSATSRGGEHRRGSVLDRHLGGIGTVDRQRPVDPQLRIERVACQSQTCRVATLGRSSRRTGFRPRALGIRWRLRRGTRTCDTGYEAHRHHDTMGRAMSNGSRHTHRMPRLRRPRRSWSCPRQCKPRTAPRRVSVTLICWNSPELREASRVDTRIAGTARAPCPSVADLLQGDLDELVDRVGRVGELDTVGGHSTSIWQWSPTIRRSARGRLDERSTTASRPIRLSSNRGMCSTFD